VKDILGRQAEQEAASKGKDADDVIEVDFYIFVI
jgi:hypothetical protein